MLVWGHLRRAVLVAAVCLLAAPAAAQAWTVTVYVHGAGAVTETTPRALMNCSVSAAGRSESSVTSCVAGTPNGLYNSFDIVNLNASVPAAAFDRGWRFLKWVDGTAANQINCDPQGDTGDHFSANCQFQIFANLWVDLYFDDTFANPVDSLSGGPANGTTTNQTTATFGFDASGDPDSNYQCRVERPDRVQDWHACGSPSDKSQSYGDLTVSGAYTFRVRSVDPSGNVGGQQSRTWTVDTTPPTVGIGGGPASGSTTNSTSAGFTLTPSETSSLQCKLDRPGQPGTFAPCGTSPSYSGLATDGAYTFSARATDVAGNTGPVASRAWTVDTTAPETSIDSGPSGETTSSSASFGFSSTESNVTFECKLDSGPWESCTSEKAYSGLVAGSHAFLVRARDAAGNVDASEAMRTWTITASDGGQPGDGTGGTTLGDGTGGSTPGGGTGGTPSGAAPDSQPPVAVLSFAKQRLARALSKGLRTTASTTEAGKLRLDVLHRGRRVASSGTRAVIGPSAVKLLAKFTRRAKRLLGRLRVAKLTLRLTVTDPAGNRTVRKKTVKLRR